MTELGIAHDIGGLPKMAEEEASASQEGLATEDAAILDCTRSESLVHTTAESLDPVVAPSSPKGKDCDQCLKANECQYRATTLGRISGCSLSIIH